MNNYYYCNRHTTFNKFLHDNLILLD